MQDAVVQRSLDTIHVRIFGKYNHFRGARLRVCYIAGWLSLLCRYAQCVVRQGRIGLGLDGYDYIRLGETVEWQIELVPCFSSFEDRSDVWPIAQQMVRKWPRVCKERKFVFHVLEKVAKHTHVRVGVRRGG